MERWRERKRWHDEARELMVRESADAISDVMIRWVAAQHQRRITAEAARRPEFQPKRPRRSVSFRADLSRDTEAASAADGGPETAVGGASVGPVGGPAAAGSSERKQHVPTSRGTAASVDESVCAAAAVVIDDDEGTTPHPVVADSPYEFNKERVAIWYDG